MPRSSLVEIDLASAGDPRQLQEILEERLDFPGWYGRNWDAFWDAITGLVEMPMTLRFVGWAEFEARLPRDARLMRECLEEMAEKYPDGAASVEYR